ncbi:Aldehyde oxidoreductase [Pirellulimonas nuda]|uniref:Aldehyde oxidoreductase n=1 Tax=Pirellulimonas nuda TaxID=2528009 RepID=A0A518DGZ6_9BACT|nr:xanthine dehydrogenase molybdopterin binding subunit [Pirellulimonas nuda]QDU90750.1 Aldehyde oxidoreductase [Pirellulimonas nuda]
MASIGKALPHDSAAGHVTGGAHYIEDLPRLEGELWVDFVGAPTAAGLVRSIDTKPALASPGVAAVLTHADLPGVNHFGPIFHDELFLVEDRVHYLGQPIVVVAAESREAARRAAALVKIDYTEEKPVLSIDEAIAAGSYIGPTRVIARGDSDAAFAHAPHTLSGVFESGGQEQFYFESQASLAIPSEAGQIKVLCSTQNPTETQAVVAEALGLRLHEVVCECKRMGGGFGGKETQSAIPAVMTALVARHTGRPARIVLTKDADMRLTGKRHPYKTWYKAAFDDQGMLLAVELEVYSDGGAFADLSTSVMERTMLHADNAYFLPAAKITGRVCRTNLPPNTAFRGFGGPQGIAVIENILQEIAQTLGRDALDVRRANLYRDGDPHRSVTPYGQIVRDHVLPETFDQLEATSDYRARLAQIESHNAANRLTVKGIALSAVKFGISFTTKFLNQGNALVNVYTDGSIQVSTGGTEMGQGLNTKVRQLVADEFGVEPECVLLMTTSTEKSHNTSPTAASAGTDLNGAAALDACRQIKQRMAEYAASRFASADAGLVHAPEHVVFEDGHVRDSRIADPSHAIPFGRFCGDARRERVDLGARGFFATPGVDFNRETGRGNPFFYYTTGAAVAEVTIDRFTGDLTVDRIDLLMDIGRMINPGIDRGQVIGGLIQGVGWCTTEELRYTPKGALLTTGPTTYKIPNITDLPKVLNVDFIDNPKHTLNVGRSKAVGEPPLMLGIAVWLAAKHAMSQASPGKIAKLKLPATGEECLMCLTELQSKPLSPSPSQNGAPHTVSANVQRLKGKK